MGTVAVLGEPERMQGYALAGAVVIPAVGDDAVRQAWQELDSATSLVVLTPAAAEFLAAELEASTMLTAVMPE
jgi:vacuolar-type H+-ATPase subunit F/Vma7